MSSRPFSSAVNAFPWDRREKEKFPEEKRDEQPLISG